MASGNACENEKWHVWQFGCIVSISVRETKWMAWWRNTKKLEMNNLVTIKDLAKALKISVSTVSRALRNTHDVNSATRETVLKLANELHYEPNFIAQSLVRKKTKIIGVVVPSINSNYFSESLSGMSDLSIDQHYHLMICQSNEQVSLENKSIHGFCCRF